MMRKRVRSLVLFLAMCLGLCVTAGAVSQAGDTASISEPSTEENVTLSLYDISVSGLGSSVQQEETLYWADFFVDYLYTDTTDTIYTVQKDQPITVSHTGTDPDSYIDVFCFPYTKCSTSTVKNVWENYNQETDSFEYFSKDFQGEYFVDEYFCVLEKTPGSAVAAGDQDSAAYAPIPTTGGRYWNYTMTMDRMEDSSSIRAGQSVTFTLPDCGPDTIYCLNVRLHDPKQPDVTFEQTVYCKIEDAAVPGTSAQPETPSQPEPPAAPQPSFIDVPAGSWYAEAVDWAIAQGITNGTGAGTFSPTNTCTKAQILTFLWRANGSPEPTRTKSLCIADLPAGQYYTEAVLWAEENTLLSHITPLEELLADCTRQEVVLYLWQLAGSPSSSRSLPFTDVPGGMALYVAVGWAMDQEITGGTSATTFSPGGTCTRAEIVTFLFRAYA